MALAKRKLLNFKKKHGDAPCNLQQPEWTVPERFIARRPHPTEPGWEVLVKWCELGYEHATWEVGTWVIAPLTSQTQVPVSDALCAGI